MRAEGGYHVSARRENNTTTWFRVVAERDGLIRIRDNFGGHAIHWNRNGAKKVNGNFEFECKAGTTIEATLPVPTEVPPAPPNVAAPVEAKRR